MTFADSRKHSSSQLQNSTLSQLQGNVVVPSTLSMKERTNLRRNDPYEYGRIYNTSNIRGMSVYDRLTADASVRKTLKTQTITAAPSEADNFAAMARAAAISAAATAAAGMDKDSSSSRKAHTTSGFVHNNNLSLTCRQQAADAASTAQAPLSALHPITLRSYYKKFPMDFMAAARPQARTTTETMRMLGTYHNDFETAKRLGVHIANGCSCAGLSR